MASAVRLMAVARQGASRACVRPTLQRCNLMRGMASTPFEATGNAKEDADKGGDSKAVAGDGGVKTLTLGKAQLAAELAKAAGLDKTQSEAAVGALMDTIMNTVAGGGKISLAGFGFFEGRLRKGRVGRNPRTGETLTIAETTAPVFKPSTVFKELVKSKHVS